MDKLQIFNIIMKIENEEQKRLNNFEKNSSGCNQKVLDDREKLSDTYMSACQTIWHEIEKI